MTAAESLRQFVDALERAGVPYMLTGSYASSYHALPRATRDLDFVIWPTREQIRALVAELPRGEFYVDERVALEALNSYGQFNAISLATGWKADFIIRKPRPFSETEFSRRYRASLDGVELTIATAEDVLLAKLEWAKLGESSRQIEDAAEILKARNAQLDHAYLTQWIRQLGVDPQWEAALRVAGIG
ncbi:MAG TPA: hypothetical protein VGX50_21715 [Longimicrobium sp.]|nr:hypothetical protein [Longimicrobium sp.]